MLVTSHVTCSLGRPHQLRSGVGRKVTLSPSRTCIEYYLSSVHICQKQCLAQRQLLPTPPVAQRRWQWGNAVSQP